MQKKKRTKEKQERKKLFDPIRFTGFSGERRLEGKTLVRSSRRLFEKEVFCFDCPKKEKKKFTVFNEGALEMKRPRFLRHRERRNPDHHYRRHHPVQL